MSDAQLAQQAVGLALHIHGQLQQQALTSQLPQGTADSCQDLDPVSCAFTNLSHHDYKSPMIGEMHNPERAHLNTVSGQPAMVLIGKEHVSQLGGLVRAACLKAMQVAVGALQPSEAVHDGRHIDDAGRCCSYQLRLKQPGQGKRSQVVCLQHQHTAWGLSPMAA